MKIATVLGIMTLSALTFTSAVGAEVRKQTDVRRVGEPTSSTQDRTYGVDPRVHYPSKPAPGTPGPFDRAPKQNTNTPGWQDSGAARK
jgi:hypothetical protein